MTIPVTNLYYLYCYAWRRFAAIQDKDVFAEHAPEHIADLWAMVLSQAFERQVRRGLDHGYRTDEGRLSLPRGRIDPVRSTATGALALAMVECRWDEFVSDTPANRIIKAIMRRLATCADLDRSLAHRLGRLWRGLDQVANVEPTLQSIRSVQINRHNAAYGLMLDVCALVLQFLVPADGAGEFRFNDPRRDDAHMARVFQDFLTAWFEQHCDPREFSSIGATKLNWPAEAIGPADDLKHLPAMLTDITMRGPNRVLIIDAKYYHEALIARHEDATKKIISGHLYQLYSYLSTWHNDHPNGPHPQGMLVYPTVNDPVELNVKIHGFAVRVITINLAQPWQGVAKDLGNLLASHPSTGIDLSKVPGLSQNRQ